ncbi:hypothetical protein JNUCC42_06000 [Brevibacterium sp. JNUCC-42]|nr:hypothetical protein JNUCC42_06000 [Brevibacterium sp. JNUCC-42]
MYLFKNKTFSILNGIGFLMSVGMFGAIMFIPLFMQGIIGMSPSQSGTMMIPMMVSMMVASILGGQLVRKIGVKTQIIIGMLHHPVNFSAKSVGHLEWQFWEQL